jgi:hypothetical protein
VTREEADRIVRAHITSKGLYLVEPNIAVRTLDEAGGIGMWEYGLADSAEKLTKMINDCWLVYVCDGRGFVLRSSHLVIVSKVDGSIKYSGSACDEG